jgi:hypothetical protein
MSDAQRAFFPICCGARRRRKEEVMSKIMRIAVLAVSLVSLFGVLSSAAGATTWTNSSDTNFTATSAGSVLSVGAVSLNCTGAASTATGSAAMATPGVSPVIVSGTMVSPSCRAAGQHATEDCVYGDTGVSIVSGVTTMTEDYTCDVYQLSRASCHLQGEMTVTYTNPAPRGLFARSHSSTVRVFDGTGGRCPLGTNVAGTLTPVNFTVTSGTGGPVFSRD